MNATARRYEHILVDEFQDTNLAQYALLKKLVVLSTTISLLSVMPTSRSIAGGEQITAMSCASSRIFRTAQIILLEQNYRSTQQILDVAMAVIDPNPNRTPKQLFTERAEGLKVILHETYDDRQEASFIVDTTASLVGRGPDQTG